MLSRVWIKFRTDLIQLLEQTISKELAQEFETATADWIAEA